MMNISRENYEIWFIDFIDGKLDGEARKELNTFLQANADLKEELKSFEELKLEPSSIPCDAAERLYKSESDLMEISRPDYLLVKQMEGGLTEEEEKELASIMREDESLIRRGVEFQHTRLVAESIPYERKSSLLQRHTRPLWLNLGRIAAAAVAAALLLTFWDSNLFFTPEQDELAFQPLSSRPAVVSVPAIPETTLASVKLVYDKFDLLYSKSDTENDSYEVLDNDKFVPNIASKEEPLTKLRPNMVEIALAGQLPNAYETGLRQMMPMYLDINRNNDRLLTSVQPPNSSPEGETFLMKGLQFVDRVSGDLVNFDKLYDEDGKFVAYNFKAGYFEVERKIRR